MRCDQLSSKAAVFGNDFARAEKKRSAPALDAGIERIYSANNESMGKFFED